MHYNLMILASAIVLASASFTVFAEETGTADEAAATSEEATTAPAETATSGEAGKQTKLSRPVEKIDDWFKECEMVTSEKGEQIEICQISQTLIDEETNTAMMKIAVGYVPDKDQPVAVITLPLGIFLPPGIELQIDGKGKVGRLPINTCMPSGCQAGVQLDEDFVTRMKKGNQMTVTFGNPQGQGIAAPVSLSGFTAGLESLEAEKKKE